MKRQAIFLVLLLFAIAFIVPTCNQRNNTQEPNPLPTHELTETPIPTLTQDFIATPTPIPSNTTQSPTKIESGLSELLWYYEHPEKSRSPEMQKVFSQAEKVGGLRITIKVNHELSEDELSYLEREFAAKFTTDQYGKVVHIGEFYHPIVPFDKIKTLAVLPYIIGMSTGAWPPLVPATKN